MATVKSFMGSVRMSLSASECVEFSVENAWIALPVAISINGLPVHFVGVNEPFYLGLTYKLAKGFHNDHHLKTLEVTIVHVGRLTLKPHQKICCASIGTPAHY